MDHDGREAFGSWYDDYTVGDIYKHWPGRTVNEYDDTLFSMITMNHAPLHIDEHYMSSSQFGQRLVNGLFVISLVVGMTVREISGKAIANLEYETIKHLGPTFHGDTIYAETEILEKRESKSKNDRGHPLCRDPGVESKGRDYSHAAASGDDTEEGEWGGVRRC